MIINLWKLKVEKSAKLIINRLEPIISADKKQTNHLYGANLYPEFSLNNAEKEVTYKLFKDGREVFTNELYKIGNIL